MDDPMRNRKFTIIIIFVIAVYWMFESLIHHLVFLDSYRAAFLPTDDNELWMRLGVVVLIFVFGIYAEIQTGKLLAKEREKQDVFIATVSSAQHILNNLLNQMQIVLYGSDGDAPLDDATRKMFKRALVEGKEQIDRLSSVTEIDKTSIRESIEI
jgi:hypothetical protein